jgi:hypothetical protein
MNLVTNPGYLKFISSIRVGTRVVNNYLKHEEYKTEAFVLTK